eukprot:780-Prymnesium_polylepis.1
MNNRTPPGTVAPARPLPRGSRVRSSINRQLTRPRPQQDNVRTPPRAPGPKAVRSIPTSHDHNPSRIRLFALMTSHGTTPPRRPLGTHVPPDPTTAPRPLSQMAARHRHNGRRACVRRTARISTSAASLRETLPPRSDERANLEQTHVDRRRNDCDHTVRRVRRSARGSRRVAPRRRGATTLHCLKARSAAQGPWWRCAAHGRASNRART